MDDFDFYTGSWNVACRRLETLFEGCDTWYEFTGTSTCRPIFGGGGNIEEIHFPTLGNSGFALRLFDVERKEWSIHWAGSRTGLLEPPVVGTFAEGRGDFYGDDTHDGKPIKVHLSWSDITGTSARWEQEFSLDEGRTWESNWVMEFTRA
ncbi:hypothetical protein [Amycolatopsis sp. lyj-112]|uniref:hypothetical protein n=1 Tax=Amycolatopsis sp. lyj-112 TaxID=2789288 RepID=UPI00397B5BA8